MKPPSPLWILMLLAAVLSAGWWFFGDYLTFDALIEQERWLRALVTEFPFLSFVIGFFVYTAAALVPGTAGKAIVYGWLFGFWGALVLVNTALTVAALIMFMAMRYIFHDWVHLKFATVIRTIDEALQRDGAFYLLTLRLMRAPYSLTNYAAGATDVQARTFWWTTQLGILPGNIAFVLAGAQLPTLRQIAEQGAWSVVNLPLLLGLSLTALIPLIFRWLIHPPVAG